MLIGKKQNDKFNFNKINIKKYKTVLLNTVSNKNTLIKLLTIEIILIIISVNILFNLIDNGLIINSLDNQTLERFLLKYLKNDLLFQIDLKLEFLISKVVSKLFCYIFLVTFLFIIKTLIAISVGSFYSLLVLNFYLKFWGILFYEFKKKSVNYKIYFYIILCLIVFELFVLILFIFLNFKVFVSTPASKSYSNFLLNLVFKNLFY